MLNIETIYNRSEVNNYELFDEDLFDDEVDEDFDEEFSKYVSNKSMTMKEKRIIEIKRVLYEMCAISDISKVNKMLSDKNATYSRLIEIRRTYFNTDDLFGYLCNYSDHEVNNESSSSHLGSDIRINKSGDTALIYIVKRMLRMAEVNPNIDFKELPVTNCLNQCLLALCSHEEKDFEGNSAFSLAEKNDKVFEAFFDVYMIFMFK